MKIPASVRDLYDEIRPRYERLRGAVDPLVLGRKNARWHYESRIKAVESYALKLETCRVDDPSCPEDMFGCTLVVENHSKIAEAAGLITALFEEKLRRPPSAGNTSLRSDSFAFDDLRLYVAWNDDPALPPSGLDGLLFEVQVKTFLQHAWGIATHDLIYKSDEVTWGGSRVAYQVKAMLENAELSISEARRLQSNAMLARADAETVQLGETIIAIHARWADPNQLPTDLQRLARNLVELARLLRVDLSDLWGALDASTEQGRGAKTLDLSPYGAVLRSLIEARGASLFNALLQHKKRKLFVPAEIELPSLSQTVLSRIVRGVR